MGLYTHKMLSHHDTVSLYHTCQHPINKALTHYILKQTSTKYTHKPSRTRLARKLRGGGGRMRERYFVTRKVTK